MLVTCTNIFSEEDLRQILRYSNKRKEPKLESQGKLHVCQALVMPCTRTVRHIFNNFLKQLFIDN